MPGVNEQLPIPALIVAVVQRVVPNEFLNAIVPVNATAVFDVTVAESVNAEPAVGDAGEIVGVVTAEVAFITCNVKVLNPVTPEEVAVSVLVVSGDVTVGVPEIMPVEVFREIPVGSDGEIE